MRTRLVVTMTGLCAMALLAAACSSPTPVAPAAVTVVNLQPTVVTAVPTTVPAPATAASAPATAVPVPATAASTKAAAAQPTQSGTANIANPASVNCQQQGGKTEIRKDPKGGEVGYCVFPDKSECEEWALMRGECKPGAQTATVKIGKTDNGKTIQAAKGSIVLVVLEGAPGSTGYTWNLTSGNDAVLKPQFDPAQPLEVYTAGVSIPGAPGAYNFRFTAASAGTAVLKFVNKQAWVQSDPQAETFGVTVVVK